MLFHIHVYVLPLVWEFNDYVRLNYVQLDLSNIATKYQFYQFIDIDVFRSQIAVMIPQEYASKLPYEV
jgi:hypothetical protein